MRGGRGSCVLSYGSRLFHDVVLLGFFRQRQHAIYELAEAEVAIVVGVHPGKYCVLGLFRGRRRHLIDVYSRFLSFNLKTQQVESR